MTDTPLPGFDTPPPPLPPKTSAGRRRTEKQHRDLDNGIHPATGARLLHLIDTESEKTCGDCTHFVVKRHDKTYFKCALVGNTDNDGTDIRKTWPACTMFRAAEE